MATLKLLRPGDSGPQVELFAALASRAPVLTP